MKSSYQRYLLWALLVVGLVSFLVVRHHTGLKIYSRVFGRLGSEYGRDQKNALAEKYLKRAIAMDRQSPEGYAHLGDHYLEVGDVDSAFLFAEQALALNPEFAQALFLMGRINIQRHRYEDAIPYLQQAIHQPGQWSHLGQYRYHLGQAFLSLGDKSSAIKEIEALRDLDQPDFAKKLQAELANF